MSLKETKRINKRKEQKYETKTYIYATEVLLFIHSHNLSFLHCQKKREVDKDQTLSLKL